MLKEGQWTEGKALNFKTRALGYSTMLELPLLGRFGTFLFFYLKLRARRLVSAMVSPPDA